MSSEAEARLDTDKKIEIITRSKTIMDAVQLLYALAIDCGIRRYINLEYKAEVTKKDIILRFEIVEPKEGLLESMAPDPWIPTWHEFHDWVKEHNKTLAGNQVNIDDVYWYLTDIASNILNDRITEKNKAIEEREACLDAISKIQKSFETRKWIMDGRGAYPDNDDRYREEVRYIMDDFTGIISNMYRQIKSKTCDYRIEVEKQIGSDNERLKRELSTAHEQNENQAKRIYAMESERDAFAEWCATNGWNYFISERKWFHRKDVNKWVGKTTKELFEFSKS